MTTEIEQLKDLTERLNQPKGSWDWDIVNDILLWSTAVFPMFGLTPLLFGRTYKAFLITVHPEDRQKVKDAVDAALDPERAVAYSIDHRILLPNGREKTVHEEAEVFFDYEGKAIRMTGTVQDITEFGRNSDEEWRSLLRQMVENGAVEIVSMRKDVQANALAIARLQETSSAKLRLWTIVGGAIPATILLLILWLTGKL